MSNVKTLDEFTNESFGEYSSGFNELQFTGNWFIDAGILGFVNLMEEVYGWDLEELQKIVVRIPNEKLLSQFTYAFWYKVIKDTTERWLDKDLFKNKDLKKNGIDPQELKKSIKEHILNEIYRKNEELRVSVMEIEGTKNIIASFNRFVKDLMNTKFLEYEIYLKKVFAQNKKTLLDQLKSVGIIGYNDFFTNLSIFNPSSNVAGKEENILTLFDKLIWEGYVRKDKKIKNIPTNVLDKSLSPFIYSASDFHNEYYGKPTTLRTLEVITSIKPVVYLLTVPFSFVWISGKNYLFYAPDIKFAYHVNKKLRYYIKNVGSLSNEKNIFKITWNAILDTLIEYKSQYSLENMYILEFSGIQNQQIQNVDYIGILKLQASIIIDDTIRDALNKNIPVKTSNGRIEERVWILEEFIKNKPLLPHLIHHIHIYLADRINRTNYVGKRSLVYASIVDAKIREFGGDNRLFGEGFFKRYREILTEIKDDARWAFSITKAFKDLFEDQDERKSYANLLLTAIRRNDKYRFVNTLLKAFTEKKSENKNIKNLVNFTFNKILSNDLSWKNYAFIFVVGLVSGGGEVNGES